MSDITQATRITFEDVRTRARLLEWGVAIVSAVALALAFPRAQQAWLAPLAATGLFWAWLRLSWKSAFFAAWLSGAIFFGISFSWFTYTVGSYVGGLSFFVVMIPAVIEALAFGLSALAYRAALRWSPGWIAPAAGAAAFTIFEWLRSIDVTGVPFAQIGYTQTGTLLGIFAAYIGSFGVTFVVMFLGAYAASAIATRRVQTFGIVLAVVAVSWAICFAYWPARHAAPPSMMIGVVQGNIAQSIKWDKSTLPRSVAKYTSLTKELVPFHPALVIWPETVITADLNVNPVTAVTTKLRAQIFGDTSLIEQFSTLARNMRTTLVVGSLDLHWGPEGLREYNALYTFASTGALYNVYDKRQLVPFAESLLAPALFSWLPDVSLIGRFGHGMTDTVVPAGQMSFAPLICWESAFPDLIHAQIDRGAQFLVIATDDAWFGESNGTYQHAQIAQMRAIESGEWVVQSASTGISGIISPAGNWTQATGLNKEAVLAGKIGLPPGSVFARVGPNRIMWGLVIFYLVVVGVGFGFDRLGRPSIAALRASARPSTTAPRASARPSTAALRASAQDDKTVE